MLASGGSKDKEHDTHDGGKGKTSQTGQFTEAVGILKFLCAVRLSNQRCGSVGDAVCRHIAQALGGDCDVVGSQRNAPSVGVDAGDDQSDLALTVACSKRSEHPVPAHDG